MLKHKILIKLFVLKRVFVCCDTVQTRVGGYAVYNTGRFIMFSMITNIYNKKTKGPALIKLFTATRKLKKNLTRDVRFVHHG
jgi:hypothetical protein